MSHQLITRSIFLELQTLYKTYRSRHPILAHQNAIGLTIMLLSNALIVLTMWGYLSGNLNMWLAIVSIAFWTSFLHELEHDLIHYLYFKKQPLMHHLMMLGVWLFRPMTVNPWFRRHLHLHHHKYSGLDSDVEERGVTNGMKWDWLRALVMPDQILSFVTRAFSMYKDIRRMEAEGKFTKTEVRNFYRILFVGFLPLGLPLYLTWYAFVLLYMGLGINQLLGLGVVVPEGVWAFLAAAKPWVVLLIAPNLLRQYCLHFITSNLHYYGDVEKGNFLQQTQVLDAWWTFPMQLFCFNFGHTHAIHHFYVQETFYIRQFTAKAALEILRKNSIRFNDLGTFRRDNRYHEVAAD